MAFTPLPNSGAMNRVASTNSKAPDWGGYCTIEGELLDYIMTAGAAGDEVKIDLSAWQKSGSKGDFLSISAKVPFSARDGGQSAAPNKYAKPAGSPQGGRYDSTAKTGPREPAPEYQPRRGGIADQAMGRSAPIQTTRGPLQRTPVRNDEPLFNEPDEKDPWD